MRVSTTPSPGWYPDPADAAQQRWWDGKGWADLVRQGPGGTSHSAPPAPATPRDPPPAQVPPVAPERPDRPAPVTAPWLREAPTSGQAAPAPVVSSPAAQRIGFVRQFHAFRYRNAASVSAIVFALGYTAVEYFAHLLLLGFVPLVIAVGALRRRERLAPLAVFVAFLPLTLLFVLRGG